MAIFATGAITNVPDFLNTLAAFCVTNGWTQNFNAVEGAGRRVHLQLSTDVFINLRALVGEKGSGVGINNVNGLAVIGSTGYNGANSWYDQPGALFFVSSSNVYRTVGIMGLVGAAPAYYLFARGNMIYVWVEYSAGLYQWLMFGRMTKYSTFTGGMLYSGSSVCQNNVALNTRAFFGNIANGNSIGVNTFGALRATVSPFGAQWLVPDDNDAFTAAPKVFDTTGLEGQCIGNSANQFNNQSILIPVEICISRDGHVNHDINTNFGIEGILPDINLVNMRYLQPGQQYNDGGANTYRILPFFQKTVTAPWGVAIQEN